jgi:tyrosyl-tRNA synthetase
MDLHTKYIKLTPEEQVKILMSGTRFADESDDFSNAADKSGALRNQMQNELLSKLQKRKQLRVYYGVDPTGSSLHIGHFVPIQKLRKFQELGHHVIFMIGDYTATIGDPSGQTGERKRFTHEQVIDFAKKYTEFAFKLLDPNKTEIRYNSEWLDRLSFADIIELACIFPLKQVIARRDFQKRMDNGESLRFHEALYSLMQGFDAYKLKCDVQVAGYDQHFNLLAGRNIQQHFGDEPHVMITGPLILGTDGRKMSKSYNNSINLDDKPFDMYGKTMRIQDELIPSFLELTSSLQINVMKDLNEKLKKGCNPMDVKKCLAFNLVEQYHSVSDATRAESEFYKIIQLKSEPDSVIELKISDSLNESTWIDVCSELKLVNSKGEVRRLITQGGFYVDGQQMKDINQVVEIPDSGVKIRLGKRKYYRIVK